MVWHIQTPGATLVRHKRPQFQGVRALPEQFLRIGPRGGRCVAEGVVPSPGAGVRNRKPTGLRNPRRGGLADGTAQEFAGRLAGARCPALRSRRPFRLGDGVPARPCRALRGMGIPGVPNISSQRKCWGGFRGGGRRAEPGLRTSRHLCPEGVKRACGRLCPAGVKPRKNRPRRGRSGIKKVLSEGLPSV